MPSGNRGCLHVRVVRPQRRERGWPHVDESSVKAITGLVKVVVCGDYLAVVAETQHEAITAARLHAVRWKPGPVLPPQKTFHDHMQQQPSKRQPAMSSAEGSGSERGSHHAADRETHAHPLVLWGWHLGDGRTPIPMPQETFLREVEAWVATGSACPGRPVNPKQVATPH